MTTARPLLAANARAEANAQAALEKAEADYLSMNYASGAAKLDRALRVCESSNCTAATQAALLRDIGTMEFRAGDRGFAVRAFGEAIKLEPTIDLNPSYDAADLRAVWTEVKGGGAASAPAAPSPATPPPAATASAPPPSPQPSQPTGDFVHAPPAEQKVDTPLPIYVEGGPDSVTRVVLTYKSASDPEDADWKHLDLQRVGAGWGGQIPCNDVSAGTLRYFIQGYSKDMDVVGTNGTIKVPYQVPIRQELIGPPPHLPNKSSPRACHGGETRPPERERIPDETASTADCPPGLPGCGKAAEEDATNAEGTDEEVDEGNRGKKGKGRPFPRVWIGVAAHLDFMQLPSGNDLCRLVPATNPAPGQMVAQPANSAHVYCTDPSGGDFPLRSDNGKMNDQLRQGAAGQSGGGLVAGDLRLMVSLDYAVNGNLLIGLRGGYVFLAYPGQAAVNDNYAFGPRVYGEARITGLIAKNPMRRAGAAPMVFVGGGVSTFDGHVSSSATVAPPGGAPSAVPVDLWITNGPGFVDVGAGVRYAPTPRVALVGAVRLNVSFGNNGTISTFGPELGVQYGF
jgi:hypothetical protein